MTEREGKVLGAKGAVITAEGALTSPAGLEQGGEGRKSIVVGKGNYQTMTHITLFAL